LEIRKGEKSVKQPSIYVKMKVLGAIDVVAGKTRHERIQNVAQMTFLDEEGNPYRFTWRTIQTWYYRYKNYGVTGMANQGRADKGATRKVTPEEVLEAVNTALPHFHGKQPNKRASIVAASKKDCSAPTRSPATRSRGWSKSTRCSRRTPARTNGGSPSACGSPISSGRPTPCSVRMSSAAK
jgi:hypothetical protein